MSDAINRLAAELERHPVQSSPPPDMSIMARPFVYEDPEGLPPREWLYKPHYIRGYVSLTVSPGGVGKSTLTLTEGLAMASNKPLLGIQPLERIKVLILNGEDPLDELERRIHASMIHHHLSPLDVEGYLFYGSGRDADLIIAEAHKGETKVCQLQVDALVGYMKDNGIGLLVIDPFVYSHRVSENDNGAIDLVAKTLGRIASATGSAVEIVHHTRKTNGTGTSVEDGRGASALLAAARHARTLTRMTAEEATTFGIALEDRHHYVRVDDGKANMNPPSQKAVWFRLANVSLPNGDCVQAAAPYKPPNAFEGVTGNHLYQVQQAINAGCVDTGEGWRADGQVKEGWIGDAIAKVLKLDLSRVNDKAKVNGLLKEWLRQGSLKVVKKAFGGKKGIPFVEVGRRAEI